MKGEVTRSVAGREGDPGWIIRNQLAVLGVEFPDEDFVEAEIDMQDEFSGRIGLGHVDVRVVVSAEGERAGRRSWSAAEGRPCRYRF